ncbi:MAG: hypothetical protein A2X08_01235 [Bacteroidetes bacterium GWA2_32_17]|nr:MAG: hypothetical protein A2X08_01235 [Bacteroidetes bacterium GWA2_32_17]
MKIIVLHIIITIIITFFTNELNAQVIYPDAGSWNTFNVDYKLNKKLSAVFTEELRFKENFTRLNLFYTNLGLEYKLSNMLKVAIIYRFVEKYQDDNSFSFRHRIMFDLTLKKKFDKIGFSYRQRVQAEKRDIYSSDIGYLPEWYSRNKFTLKYDTDKRYTPYAAVELRYQFRNPREWESDNTLHRSRYSIGVDYKINKKSTFGLYYLIQREFNVVNPQYLYIVGMEYSISL